MSLVELKNISKSFYSIPVLQQISFEIQQGEVHGLVGENGAGKSTLMNIVSGLIPRDKGRINIKGQPVIFNHPREAEAHGIVHIHQELNILPELSVVDNLFLGKEIRRYGILDKKSMEARAKEILSELGQSFDINERAGNLSVGHQQIIEIAKALLHSQVKLIILDEPSASLTDKEIAKLFAFIEQLKNGRNVSFIYVTHRLSELFEICDRITVLRDGQFIATKSVEECGVSDIVTMMIGKNLEEQFRLPQSGTTNIVQDNEILKVEALQLSGKFKDISFSVYKGEILGFFGLVGAGRTEVMHAIYGSAPGESGNITFDGKTYHRLSPYQSLNLGIGFLSEDRKSEGIFSNLDISTNILISNYKKNRLESTARELIDRLSIKLSDPGNSILTLSGGNQQKALFARNLNCSLKLLILDEPTRGIDVGAKSEIYKILRGLSDQGISIIMVSSEMHEILALSDRIAVMYEGAIVDVIPREQASEEHIMKLCTNTHKESA